MADPGHTITRRTVGRLAEVTRRVLGSGVAPDGKLRRVQQWDDGGGLEDGTDPNGNGGGEGCACCGCLICIDLCEQDQDKVISTCAACESGATSSYLFNPGTGGIYPAFGGQQEVTWSSGCTWLGPMLTAGGGNYRWLLTQDGSNSTLELVWMSGSDPLNIKDNVRLVQWQAAAGKEWSCLCNSTMVPAVKGEKFPRGLEFKCEVCITPKKEKTAVNCTWFEKCWSAPWSLGPINLADDSSGCGTGLGTATTISIDPAFPMTPAPGTSPAGCCWHTDSMAVDSNETIEGTGYSASAVICVECSGEDDAGNCIAGFIASLQVTLTIGTCAFTAEYATVDEPIVGANTFFLVPGSVTATGVGGVCACEAGNPMDDTCFPASVIINATDCSYGDTHPDYGYGCGGQGTYGCDTDQCDWTALNEDGNATGPGPYHWVKTGGVGYGCAHCGGCAEPDFPASEGGSGTTYCLDA